jgi:hypothetical protein
MYDYGTASIQYAPMVAKFINQYGISDLLDYGAGKLNLIKTISKDKLVDRKFSYCPYEPSNPQYADKPEPTEMVACLDVLEHIEPECIDDVLDDLKRVTECIGLFTVSCVPAAKVLPDGRNAHLIQEPAEWWLPKIMSRFELQSFQRTKTGFFVLVKRNVHIDLC